MSIQGSIAQSDLQKCVVAQSVNRCFIEYDLLQFKQLPAIMYIVDIAMAINFRFTWQP